MVMCEHKPASNYNTGITTPSHVYWHKLGFLSLSPYKTLEASPRVLKYSESLLNWNILLISLLSATRILADTSTQNAY